MMLKRTAAKTNPMRAEARRDRSVHASITGAAVERSAVAVTARACEGISCTNGGGPIAPLRRYFDSARVELLNLADVNADSVVDVVPPAAPHGNLVVDEHVELQLIVALTGTQNVAGIAAAIVAGPLLKNPVRTPRKTGEVEVAGNSPEPRD